MSLFAPQDLANLLGGSVISLRFLVTRAVKRGDILKLRRGLYALTSPPPADLQVANALYRPSYVSFSFALSYHHIIPEAVYAVTSATPRATSSFNAFGKRFVYHHLKPRAFTGCRAERVQDQTVWIAEPEKAVVDTLYFSLLRKLGRPERMDTSGLSAKRIKGLAELFGRQDLMEAIREL
jgi:predicted transcriptional regulator of viral defense system